MCTLIFSKTFVWNIYHYKKNWARCDWKCTLVLTQVLPIFVVQYFNETWILSTYFRKNTQLSDFLKIQFMWAEMYHADWLTDWQTDMTKLVVAFRSFANVSNK